MDRIITSKGHTVVMFVSDHRLSIGERAQIRDAIAPFCSPWDRWVFDDVRIAVSDIGKDRSGISDQEIDGCGPHCGHHADMVELTTLRKSYAAVLDQKRALLAEVEALRAEIAYLQAAAR